MQSVENLLDALRTKGVDIWFESDRLRYRSPKSVSTEEDLRELRARKAEVISFFLNRNDRIASPSTVQRSESVPLSFAQQRLWFLDQLMPNTLAYNLAGGLRLIGPLDVDALSRAFDTIVERHEALRTVFRTVDGTAYQVVLDNRTLELPVLDMRDRSEASISEFVAEDVLIPFNLTNGPLFKALLIREGNDRHLLVMTIHHIISDGWSIGLLANELTALYAAYRSNRLNPLPKLPAQYRDFTCWQREQLQGAVLKGHIDYWRRQLDGVPALEFPTDRKRPAVQTIEGARQRFHVDAHLAKCLRSLGNAQRCTLFMTLFAAYLALLRCYTRQDDICLGIPVANRNHPEIEPLIGFFVNTLPLRIDLSGRPSFVELLRRVRETTLAAYEHQDAPFERLVDELGINRDLSRTPLVQMLVLFDNLPATNGGFADLQLELVPVETGVAEFDLTLGLRETPDGIAGQMTYSTALFDASTIERFARHYVQLLKQIVARPESRIGNFRIVTDDDVVWLREQNPQPKALERDHWFHALFERQVERTPNAPAVVFGDKQLTYAELNRRSNHVARYLRERGVGPDATVGLCIERSLEMIVGLLAVLKAGGAFLPLDSQYPDTRLSYVLQDAAVKIVLTQRSFEDRLRPIAADAQCVALDVGDFGVFDETNLEIEVRADNLAYVIYTSGSTGEPKGVMITHSGLRNVSDAAIERFGKRGGSRVLQFARLAFDAAILDATMALGAGGSVHLLTTSLPMGRDLAERMQTEAIEFIALPPTALASISDYEFPALHTVVVAGEACPTELADQWMTRCRLMNGYGPTETTVCATMGHYSTRMSCVPIGRPIPNTDMHVLDEELNPVPPGVSGELCIGGLGLARGYLGRPGLTAEKFVAHPFGAQGGERLYRTGDLVRYLPDGNLDFIGRIDSQIKLRGFRIELGEIEAVLMKHDGIRECVAVVREEMGHKQLVAYLVAHDRTGAELEGSALRAYLLRSLPEYMVPAAFVLLRNLPLSANGKVDRKALPAPGVTELMSAGYVAPRNETEERLAKIWAEVLRIARVGVNDNFFELGGDSIIAIQVIHLARKTGVAISPRQLFEYKTVAGLASVAANVVEPLETAARISGEVPLTPIQEWFFESRLPNPNHFNQSRLFEIAEPLDKPAFALAVRTLIEHHDALRMRFWRDAAGRWHQEYGTPDSAASSCSVIDLRHLPSAEQKEALEQHNAAAQASLNLEAGKVFRAVYYELGGMDRVLLVCHHLVVDGVSWLVLGEDLFTAYRQHLRREAVKLPPRTTSFKAWAERVCARARSAAVPDSLRDWLRSPPKVCTLPTDAQGANTNASARTIAVQLDQGSTRLLLQKAPASYRTQINDLLIAALGLAVSEWIGSDSVLIDLEGHGRQQDLVEDADLSRTVGWFTAIYPVHLQIDRRAPLGEIVKHVKERLRARPHGGVDYGLLRYLSSDDVVRQRLGEDRAPISFNYLGQLGDLGEGLRLAPENMGPAHDPDGQRRYLIDINCAVVAECLSAHWSFSSQQYSSATVIALADRYLAILKQLVDHCVQPDSGGYTPSDFPLCRLTQAELDRLYRRSRWIEDVYPLAPLQSGLLFHWLSDAKSGEYFMQSRATIHGEMDYDVFRESWSRAMRRHTSLRSVFDTTFDEPLQVVYSRMDPPVTIEDWRGFSAANQQARLMQWLKEDIERGSDLTTAPPWRVTLLRTAEKEHVFVFGIHHIVTDGWSLARLFPEVFGEYFSLSEGRSANIESARPYRDYVAWLQQQDKDKAEQFWSKELQGLEPTILTSGRALAGAVIQPHHAYYRKHLVTVPAETAEQLERFAKSFEVTANTVTQGAWALVLHRCLGRADVCFGMAVATRPADLVGSERIQGLLINALPVRSRLDGAQRCWEWLQRLQKQAMDTKQYDYMPLNKLQSYAVTHGGEALFNTWHVFVNYPTGGVAQHNQPVGPLTLSDWSVREQDNFDLTIAVGTDPLQISASFDERRFDPAFVDRLLDRYLNVIHQIVARPDGRVGDLNLLTKEERLLLSRWNATQRKYDGDRCIHELFEQQVEKTPDAIAVVFEDEELTYRELNRRSNQIAHALIERGVGPDIAVGLCAHRSVEAMVGLLGILKAGGAYVPVDPRYPDARIEYVLEDARPKLVLASAGSIDRLSEVCFGMELKSLSMEDYEGHPPGNPRRRVAKDNLAYVIYTSGSTGRPKGVCITHTSLVNSTQARSGVYEASRAFLLLSPLTFDSSVAGVFATLTTGGCLVVPSDEAATRPDLISTLAWRHGVDHVLAVPILLSRLSEDAGAPEWAALKTVTAAGEACAQSLAAAYTRAIPQCTFVNEYGPTEATVWATQYKWSGECDAETLPIGRPIANADVHVLDEDLNHVPVGVAGELYIGGVGLARGYLNNMALTAEKFVAHPFSGDGGQRMYRTGDLVRYREDGNLEFIGRIDNQVKILGFRIEPGEIEAALLTHSAVRECAVVARGEIGHKRLVAYVVGENGNGDLQDNALREYLLRSLPEHMVPAAFVRLDVLPLNDNGKVDRRALPEPGAEEALKHGYVAPRNWVEERLAQIWTEVLRVERVGVNDSFFALGGDSIVAIQIIDRARRDGIGLVPRQFFEQRTVGGLAAVASCSAALGGVVAEQGLVSGEVPLTPVQHWFFAQSVDDIPATFTSNVSLICLERVPPDLLASALQYVVDHHDALRLRFRKDADGWQQRHVGKDEPDARISFQVMDLRRVDPVEQWSEIRRKMQDVQASLDILRGPGLGAILCDFGEGQSQCLLISIHHLLFDHVSSSIFVSDLATAYRQLSRGEALVLSPKTTSFKAWAEQLLAHGFSKEVADEVEFWKSRPWHKSRPVPKDHPHGEPTNSSVRMAVRSLSEADTTVLLKGLPAMYGTQITEVLLAALVSALSEWSGDRAFAIEVERHGRTDLFPSLDVSRTVGWFTSMHPVLLELPDSERPADLLAGIKTQLREIPRDGMGYGILHYLRGMKILPPSTERPEVCFNYIGRLDGGAVSAGIFRVLEEESSIAVEIGGDDSEVLTVNSEAGCTPYLIVALGHVVRDRLQIRVLYSKAVHEPATIGRLLDSYVASLRSIVGHASNHDRA